MCHSFIPVYAFSKEESCHKQVHSNPNMAGNFFVIGCAYPTDLSQCWSSEIRRLHKSNRSPDLQAINLYKGLS